MKSSPQDCLKQVHSARAVLVYGPDEGLIKETCAALLKAKGVGSSQSMGYVALSGKNIKDHPALLQDELNAWGLLEQDRVVCVQDASDGLTSTVKEIFERPSVSPVLTVLVAGELGPSSSLRKFFESAPQALSVPCYALSGGDLAAHVRKVAQRRAKVLEDEALRYTVATLGNDSAVATSEMEKVCLYVGDRSTITLDDVQAILAENGQHVLDDLVILYFEKRRAQVLQKLDSLFEESLEPIALIRSFLRHIRRLREVHLYRVHEGLAVQQGMLKLSPPVFWKHKDAFLKAAQQVSYAELESLEDRLQSLEFACKQSGSFPQLLIKHFVATTI